ncbi:MAG: TonB-dependent receptor [Acetobacter persici]|uniref:TonB-dependent receptor n=1 Tax=Acetobacter persici TaxID=1076596 RepID=UPI0039E9DE53
MPSPFVSTSRRFYWVSAFIALLNASLNDNANAARTDGKAVTSASSVLLSDALTNMAEKSGVNILFRRQDVTGLKTQPVAGNLPVEEAVRRMLRGTHLTVRRDESGALVISPPASGLGVPTAAAKTANSPAAKKKAFRKSEEITVSGNKVSDTTTKRHTVQIMDTLSAEQIRTIPDTTVVEAARRIVGVSVMPSTDDNHADNSMQNVTIRGLDAAYNLVTIDGAQLASADNSYRGAKLDMVPSSMLGELQVLKTLDAYNDPQGLGGQLNLVTKNAFKLGNSNDVQVLGGWNSLAGSVASKENKNWRASGTISRVFGKDKRFGFVLSGDYQEIHTAQHAILPGDTTGDGWVYYPTSGTSASNQTTNIDASTGSAVPVRVQDYAFDDTYRRYGLSGKLQYKVTDRLHLSFFTGYYHEEDQEVRYEALAMPSGIWQQGANGQTGHFTTGQYQFGTTVQPDVRHTWFFNGKLHYDITDAMQLDLLASDSIARDHQGRFMYKYNTGMNETTNKAQYQSPYGYSYNVRNGAPTIAFNDPAAANDTENYQPRYWRDYNFNVDNTVRFLRADWKWRLGHGFWVGLGANQTLTHVRNSETYNQWIPAGTEAASLIGNMSDVLMNKTISIQSAPGETFYLIDPDKAFAKLENNKSLFKSTDTTSTTKPAYYHLQESITATYFQTGWQNRYVTLQGGFRWDHTRVGIGNFNGVTENSSTDWIYQTRNSGYDYYLPSVIGILNLTPAMKVRAAFTESAGRPDYGQYGAATSTTFDGATVNISQGNPNLKPRNAYNYDLDYEWYPTTDTLLSVGLFYKDIHNEIYDRTSYGVTSMNGTLYPTVVSEPLNASGAGLRGVEFQFLKEKMTFLPGPLKNLGISFNATFLQGFYELEMDDGSQRRINGLQNQPGHMYNASLFYSTPKFEARVAYNRVGKSLYSASGTASWQDIWMQERDQIDLQVGYRFLKWATVTGQVQNLTASGYQTRMGRHFNLIQNSHPVGRSVWIGLRFQPDF